MIKPTPELIRSALECIPADLPRDEWVRVAMSIKSEYPEDMGLDLFMDWSATATNFQPKACLDTWRSVRSGGGVTLGSLLHLAKQHGFTLLASGAETPKALAAEIAKREDQRRARHQAEEATRINEQDEAASLAGRQWAEAKEISTAADATYLQRKGVPAYGVRAVQGALLVPLRDGDGKLWNLQRIAPVKPAIGSDKQFLRGGRKSGLWHLLGTVQAQPAPNTILLIAEGYATAASLHQATGYPVAVAFDAGNLVHVCEAFRKRYPDVLIVVCGDDDRITEQTTGTNPGRVKATAAAQAIGGLVVFPEGLPEGGTDFNDLHQHLVGAMGLAAVNNCVQTALNTHKAIQATSLSHKPTQVGIGKRSATQDRFSLDARGVWHTATDADGNERPPLWVCSRLEVLARTRDQDGGGWGYLLTFSDPSGHSRQWAMPARMLAGDGSEYRATLLSMGLLIATSPTARNLLTQYIQTRQPEGYAICTDRVGWHGPAFVLPHETLGERDQKIVFQSDSPVENTFRSHGSAQQWRERIGALCTGNSRLVFAIAAAFAGPLMRPARMESGGFHYRGDSSSGKTTALKVAASVYGGASFLQRWRTTDNALEATAAQHSDCLLILDELAQIDPKTAGECAYMLANEQSKARSSRTSAPRPRLSWRLMFLSAGELGLADHMAEGGKRTRAGQEVRMADIPADAGKELGAFEELHGHDGGAAFSRYLVSQAASTYGAVGRAWLLWLAERADTLGVTIRESSNTLAAKFVPGGASGQVERVAARFALVGAAGELATSAGLTGWPIGESERAAMACFRAWLAARGGKGNGEVVAMLRQVRSFLAMHGDGRFAMWHRSVDDNAPKILQRAGVRRMLDANGKPFKSNHPQSANTGEKQHASLVEGVSFEYFVLAESFRQEVCQGYDYQAVCRVLLEHGCLAPDKGRSFDCKPRLPGIGNAVCYRITPAIFELDL
jgi:putative DNA primase/helicase